MKAFTKTSRGLSKSKLAVGLFAGVLLARLIYFSVSPEFGIRSPNGELLASVHCFHEWANMLGF
jgi:hypothetical protein